MLHVAKNSLSSPLKRFVCLSLLTMIGFTSTAFSATSTSLSVTEEPTSLSATDDSTSTTAVKKPKEKLPTFTYFRIGVDLSKILASRLQKQYDALEFQVDVYYKKDLYFAAEFGGGNSTVRNDFLQYSSKNTFVSLGLDKTFFGKDFKGDFDNAFVGLRYGVGFINRSQAAYAIHDTVWGNSQGIIPAESFIAHWLELTGGFRMELMKNVFVGWNVRARTFINPKKFEKLPPSYVAGYGRGDKNSAFGYNFYLLYGLGKKR